MYVHRHCSLLHSFKVMTTVFYSKETIPCSEFRKCGSKTVVLVGCFVFVCLFVCFLHFNSCLEQDILFLDHVLHSFITSSVFELSVINQSKPLQSCSEQFLSGALQPSTPVEAGCGEIILEYLGGPNLIT